MKTIRHTRKRALSPLDGRAYLQATKRRVLYYPTKRQLILNNDTTRRKRRRFDCAVGATAMVSGNGCTQKKTHLRGRRRLCTITETVHNENIARGKESRRRRDDITLRARIPFGIIAQCTTRTVHGPQHYWCAAVAYYVC